VITKRAVTKHLS